MKKAVFITYNQALTEQSSFSPQINYRSKDLHNGLWLTEQEQKPEKPRMGSHTWPEMNSATITIVEEEMVPLILKYVKALVK